MSAKGKADGRGRTADTDPEARFEEVFRDAYPRLLAYGMRRTETGEEAEDLAAETFSIAWRRWEDCPGDPLPWLFGIARRTLANMHRSSRRRSALLSRLGAEALAGGEGHATSLAGRIGPALAALPEPDRELILLTAWEGLDARQAARALGCSRGAVYVRLHRARRRLLGELASTRAGSMQAVEGRGPAAAEEEPC